MNHDDELRKRLHDIPTPSARLDADAVLAGAKRRRRPKTIALSSAATVAGVLIFAPLVVPGLTALRPGSSVSVDSGAAPEAASESPGFGADGGADGSGDNAQTDSGAASEAGAAGAEEAPLCGLPRAGELGLVLTFVERPGGATPVQVRAIGENDAQLTAIAIDSLTIIDGAAQVDAGETREQLALAGGEAAAITVMTATLEPGACGDDTPSGPTPVAIVGLDGASPIAVVGSPRE